MFTLHLTGIIAEERQMEFEQTFLLATKEIPKSCVAYCFYKDENNYEKYHFITYWPDEREYYSYESTSGFIMVQHAFETLGEELTRQVGEEHTPLKTFRFA